MDYSLSQLLVSDGSWAKFHEAWSRQCEEIKDSIDNYALDSMPILEKFAKDGAQREGQRTTWTVVLNDSTRPLVAAMANLAPLPGFQEPVLRIRQLTVCPLMDFGALSEDTYSETLVHLTYQMYQLSEDKLPSKHIHVHLRSPADVAYFTAFGKNVDGNSIFDSVTHKGAWLHIKKK